MKSCGGGQTAEGPILPEACATDCEADVPLCGMAFVIVKATEQNPANRSDLLNWILLGKISLAVQNGFAGNFQGINQCKRFRE